MNESEHSWDRNAMRVVCQSNRIARSYLTGLARRERNFNGNTTTVDELVAETECERQRAVRLLKRFGELGCGRFVTGRRGQPSRLEWAFPAIQIAKEIVGMLERPAATSAIRRDDAPFVEHHIWLRPGVQVTVHLPVDTTKDEAEKLAGIVRNLWLAPGGQD